jgi:acetyl esterase/lipase
MVDRYRVWVGAGVLAGGMSAAMLTGAGVAAADDTSPATRASSAASGGEDSPPASTGIRGRGGEKTEKDDKDGKGTAGSRGDAAADGDETSAAKPEAEPEAGPTTEPEAGPKPRKRLFQTPFQRPGKHRATDDANTDAEIDDAAAEEPAQTEEPTQTPDPAVQEPTRTEETAQTGERPEAEETAQTVAHTRWQRPSAFAAEVDTDLGSFDGAMVMKLAAAEAPAPPTTPTLLDIIAKLSARFYDAYTDAMQFFAGPVRAPFGSTVRVESSTLTIGGHKEVPADWYFPDTEEPTGLIYLQHGILSNGSFYSATASYLAEKTNSIVVVPTLTWNPFDTGNYPLEWPSTGRAIAALFAGDRAALTASAQAAGYDGALPTRVVLAGHSAGGGLIAMIARFMAEGGDGDDLAGVVMFDGVGTLSYLSEDLAAIPESIPVYNIGAAPSSWNWYGDTNRKLQTVRPGMFTGLTLAGGRHADGMQTTSPVVQYFSYLMLGFSSPLNVMANRVLAAGWINDMFAGTHTDGLYDAHSSSWSVLAAWWRGQAGGPAVRRSHAIAV